MKVQKNTIITKTSLLILILLPISQSYGMMPRLRLGLQESLKAAATYRTTFSNALNPTFKKHASTISRGIFKTAAFGGITIASLSGDLSRKQFQFDFWPDDNNQKFLNNILIEQSPRMGFYAFLNLPKFFTKEDLEDFLNRNNDYVMENLLYFTQFLDQEFQELLKPYIFAKRSPDIFASCLLNKPYFFTKEEEQEIIAQYGDMILKGISPFHIRNLPDHLCALLRPLIIEKGSTNLIAELFLEIPNFFSIEEQQAILARSNKTTLDRIYLRDSNENLPNETKNSLRALVINQGSDEVLFQCLLLPDFFSPAEKKAIFKKITYYTVYNLDSSDLTFLPQDVKDLLVHAILRENFQDVIVTYFLKMPTLFNEAQQAEIINKHSDAIVRRIKCDQIKDLPSTVQNLLCALIIKNGSASFIVDSLFRLPGLFTNEEEKGIIKKYYSYILESIIAIPEHLPENLKNILKTVFIEKGSPKNIAQLLLEKPHLFDKEEKAHLVALHADTIITLLEETGLDSFSDAWDIEKSAESYLLSDLILEKGSEKLITTIMAPSNKQLFSEKQRNLIMDKYYKTTLTVDDDSGPLFSDYLLRHPENLLFFLNSKHEHPQFFDLFPAIEKYTQKQYAQDHIVLFHGQKSIWVLLELIYSELLQLKNNNVSSSNFKHLRFIEHSPLSETDIKNIQHHGFDYKTGLKNNPRADAILFTNLHPAANHALSNSWHYAITNSDFSRDETSFYHDIVKKIFADLEMSAQYDTIQSQDPHFFNNLYESFNTIVKKQGNHGNLVTISMPKSLAKKLVYSTGFGAKQNSLVMETSAEKVTTFDEPIPPITSTINVVKIAENFHEVSGVNAYALILAEQIINEQAAQKDDVSVKYFNTFENVKEYQDLVTTFKEKIKAIQKEKQTDAQQYKLLATFLGFLKKRFS